MSPLRSFVALVLLSLTIESASYAQTPVSSPVTLVPRFTSESGVAWTETANSTRYFDAIGRKAAVFGKQDGRFEAWIWPIKVLHGFRLEFQLDNMPEPVRGESFLQSVTVRPESTTLLYVHPRFTVKQTIWAADDRSAIVQFFDVDSDRPLAITAKFLPDFKPMWPASLGGQHSGWLDEDKAFTLSDGTGKPTAVIGSPATSANTEFMDHSLVGGEMLLRISTTRTASKQALYPVVMALSMNGADEARALYRDMLSRAREAYETKVQHWRDFLSRTLQIETPNAELNRAFLWAKISVEQGWSCTAPASAPQPNQPTPSVPPEGFAFPASEECGVVAGYGPAGDGERPGFAWWFGGDGMMASWAMLDYGDFDGAKRELRFLRAHQRRDGKMMHEMVQSAGVVDWWGKYHFAYMHADTTPMYLYSIGEAWERTGDREFLEQFWPSAKLAYQYSVSTVDPEDGLIDNTRAGLGAIEVGVLRGTVKKDIYVQGFWIGGLRKVITLARAMNDEQLAVDAQRHLDFALKTLRDEWRDPALKYFAFGVNTDGQRAELIGNWSAVLMSLGGGAGPNPQDDENAVGIYALPELATDWGSRGTSSQSQLYDPVSYNNGTAWPYASGLVAWAQYVNGQPLSAFQTLVSIAQLTGAQAPGGIPEHMVGNRNEPGERSVPHQLFSSWSMIRPLVAGLFGLGAISQADGRLRLRVAPKLPNPWESASFKNFRLGEAMYSAVFHQKPQSCAIALTAQHASVEAEFVPLLPAAASSVRGFVDRKEVRPKLWRLTLPPEQESNAFVQYSGGISITPITPPSRRGATNESLKIVSETSRPGALQLDLAGLGEHTYELEGVSHLPITVEGARVTAKSENGFKLEVTFPPADDYVRKSITIRY